MRKFCLLGAVTLALVCDSSADQKAEAKKNDLKPSLVLYGTDSSILNEGFFRITNEDDWRKLWKNHRGGDAPIQIGQHMSVDFDTHMVIAIFQGDRSYHGSIWTQTIHDKGDVIRVRFVVGSVQTGDGVKPKKVGPIRYEAGSYGFIVIPRSSKPIKFEIGNKSLIADPYTWTAAGEIPELK